MTLRSLNAVEVHSLLSRGAVLVDIRDAAEHARLCIPGALNVPLDRLTHAALPDCPAIVFYCAKGRSTHAYAGQLDAAAICESYVLAGGLESWRKAGFPIASGRGQPLGLMRQVQLARGALILLGIVLGLQISPAFLGIAALVGAGLVFAGATGWCAMARLLAAMPWNRHAAHSETPAS